MRTRNSAFSVGLPSFTTFRFERNRLIVHGAGGTLIQHLPDVLGHTHHQKGDAVFGTSRYVCQDVEAYARERGVAIRPVIRVPLCSDLERSVTPAWNAASHAWACGGRPRPGVRRARRR